MVKSPAAGGDAGGRASSSAATVDALPAFSQAGRTPEIDSSAALWCEVEDCCSSSSSSASPSGMLVGAGVAVLEGAGDGTRVGPRPLEGWNGAQL